MPKKKISSKKTIKRKTKINASIENIKKSEKIELNFKTTKEIKVSNKIIDQVIGQEHGVEIIKKAAKQRRHVFLIGDPGTGKSMLGMALAELLPKEKLVDILAFPNQNDENEPIIKTVDAGEGRKLTSKARNIGKEFSMLSGNNWFFWILIIAAMIMPWWARDYYKSDIMFTAFFLGSMFVLVGFMFIMTIGKRMNIQRTSGPKVIVDNTNKKRVPFLDATGAHAGALLGDVLHDPFQSGGLGTPAHERVVAGMIHKAHMGVLFIDEIATLNPSTQQDLLTSLQEGKYPITGQSERSAGAMVRTEAVPCKFVLVAAGNLETLKHIHPALRSRIRGYGYEVYINNTMKDTLANRNKIAVFVAQEIKKDGKIPHFDKSAVMQIINEAKARSNRKGYLTLQLRELGGLIRAAGDLAIENQATLVTKDHVIKAKYFARPLEKQLADDYIKKKKEYEVIITKGSLVGRVNGLAVIGSGSNYSGIVLPIESQITPGGKEAQFIATGKLGEIAKEAVKNVSAIIKKYFGEDIKGKYDIYVQFLQTYEGVEGDSASIAVATAIISALEEVPIKQNYCMTGSLSVRGEVLPVGGVSAKVEAAIDAGIKNIIIPKSNFGDIIIDKEKLKGIKIISVTDIRDVLRDVLDFKKNKKLKKILK